MAFIDQGMGSGTLTAKVEELAGRPAGEFLDEAQRRFSVGTPARTLFGVLPVARVIPQDFHSVLDYAGGAALLLAGAASDDGVAKACGIGLGMAVIGTSLMTDYRLSVSKRVPIEVHEVADHVSGLGAILTSFAFGRRGKGARVVHLLVGLTTIVGSLFTDYRAFSRRAPATP